jgi:hypothetical protein
VIKTAVLVGAGATLAEALPSQPSRRSRPPLDATFFDLCALLDLDGGRPLRRYLADQYGIDPGHGYRMEEVFNLVYADAVSATPPSGCLEAYWSLIRMYRDAIRETTNDLEAKSRSGVGALTKQLFRLDPNRSLTFITFNQDLVIEKAMEQLTRTKSYSAIPWNLETAYGMEFSSFGTISGPMFRRLGNATPSTRVLKLHGSLNWLYKVRSATDAKNSVRAPQGELYCSLSQRIHKSVTYAGGKRSVPVVPLIVPPVYEKSTHTRDRLHAIWSEAHEALTEADELIVFGYSFPEADIAARAALRRAFHRNRKVDHVHVIDPAPESAARISAMTHAPAVTRYSDVSTFSRFFSSRSAPWQR